METNEPLKIDRLWIEKALIEAYENLPDYAVKIDDWVHDKSSTTPVTVEAIDDIKKFVASLTDEHLTDLFETVFK